MSETHRLEHLPWQAATIEHVLQLQRQGRLPHALLLELNSHEDASPFIRYLATALAAVRRRY